MEAWDAKRTIRGASNSISSLVQRFSADIDCFAGFDQSLPTMVFINPQDEHFFTGKVNSHLCLCFVGTRQAVWLESDDTSPEQLMTLVDLVANEVRPIPVIGCNPTINTIIAVNDRYSAQLDGGTNPQTGLLSTSTGQSSANFSHANYSESSDSQRVQHSFGTLSGGSHSSQGSANDQPQSPQPPPPGRPPSQGHHPLPTGSAVVPPDAPGGNEVVPYLGIFTIEDPCGHEQCVKITFSLAVKSIVSGERVLTHTELTNFCLSFPFPGDDHEPSSRDIRCPYFICNELRITMDPDSPQLKEFEPRSRSPSSNTWDIKGIHRFCDVTKGVIATATVWPNLQLAAAKKTAVGVELDPLSRL